MSDLNDTKSITKSLSERFKSLIGVLYYLNLAIIFAAIWMSIVLIFDNNYIDNVYVLLALLGGIIAWIINELTFGMIATIIDIRDGITELNSKKPFNKKA
ncbi:hypothetical protein OAZ95_00510 [Gammaproteobacteria bacterium]|nr:hypothetical protein [Gammaproteobacteria bacterium]